MLKLSYTTMASPDWDGITAIKKAREYGYQGVDLRVSDHLGELKSSSTDAEITALKQVFEGEGIIPSSLLAYNVKVTADPGSWGKFEDSVLCNLAVGTKLGSPWVRIFIGNPAVSPDHEGFVRRAAEVLARVLAKDGSPTSLLIQNHVGGVGIGDILGMMRQVNSPRLNLVLCPANAAQMNEEFMGLLPGLRATLPQVYIADLSSGKDEKSGHYNTVLPGEGFLDYKQIGRALGGHQFKGWTTFKWEKIWNPGLPGPEVALPHFVSYIRKLAEDPL